MIDMTDLEDYKVDFEKFGHYYHRNMAVPRVTEILSKTIHEDFIVYWANSLGFKGQGYKKTLSTYAEYGSIVHKAIQDFILDGVKPQIPNISVLAFMDWWEILNKNHKINVLGVEQKLTCPWFGGTYDLQLQIDDKKYLIDFKTSNNISFKYCLQLAAYNYMLYYNGQEPVNGFIILQLSKVYREFHEYLYNMDNPVHANFFNKCEASFMFLVEAFYRTLYLEQEFRKINGGEK